MRTAKLIFKDSKYNYCTSINGTDESIKKYFLGKFLNFGDTAGCPKDDLQKCIDVIITEKKEKMMIKRVKRLVQKMEALTDIRVEVKINGLNAVISKEGNNVSVKGDDLLAVECYKLLEATHKHKISKFNANKLLKSRGV
jgi:hypothetical protein